VVTLLGGGQLRTRHARGNARCRLFSCLSCNVRPASMIEATLVASAVDNSPPTTQVRVQTGLDSFAENRARRVQVPGAIWTFVSPIRWSFSVVNGFFSPNRRAAERS
jgi:hypothetical protein